MLNYLKIIGPSGLVVGIVLRFLGPRIQGYFGDTAMMVFVFVLAALWITWIVLRIKAVRRVESASKDNLPDPE